MIEGRVACSSADAQFVADGKHTAAALPAYHQPLVAGDTVQHESVRHHGSVSLKASPASQIA